MTVELNEPTLDAIFFEMVQIINDDNNKLDNTDLEIIRVLLYDNTARKEGLLKSEIITEMYNNDADFKLYRVGKCIRRLVSHNIVGELPNLLDMRSVKYYLVCLKKYGEDY